MYELAINDCAQPVIGFYNDEDEFQIVHTLPSPMTAVSALVILGAFNQAHERAYELGMKHCSVTHTLGGGSWLDDQRKCSEGGM